MKKEDVWDLLFEEVPRVRIFKYRSHQGPILFEASYNKFHIADEKMHLALWGLAEWLCTEGEDLRDIVIETEIIEVDELYDRCEHHPPGDVCSQCPR